MLITWKQFNIHRTELLQRNYNETRAFEEIQKFQVSDVCQIQRGFCCIDIWHVCSPETYGESTLALVSKLIGTICCNPMNIWQNVSNNFLAQMSATWKEKHLLTLAAALDRLANENFQICSKIPTNSVAKSLHFDTSFRSAWWLLPCQMHPGILSFLTSSWNHSVFLSFLGASELKSWTILLSMLLTSCPGQQTFLTLVMPNIFSWVSDFKLVLKKRIWSMPQSSWSRATSWKAPLSRMQFRLQALFTWIILDSDLSWIWKY
jgi:hypothetical protein